MHQRWGWRLEPHRLRLPRGGRWGGWPSAHMVPSPPGASAPVGGVARDVAGVAASTSISALTGRQGSLTRLMVSASQLLRFDLNPDTAPQHSCTPCIGISKTSNTAPLVQEQFNHLPLTGYCLHSRRSLQSRHLQQVSVDRKRRTKLTNSLDYISNKCYRHQREDGRGYGRARLGLGCKAWYLQHERTGVNSCHELQKLLVSLNTLVYLAIQI